MVNTTKWNKSTKSFQAATMAAFTLLLTLLTIILFITTNIQFLHSISIFAFSLQWFVGAWWMMNISLLHWIHSIMQLVHQVQNALHIRRTRSYQQTDSLIYGWLGIHYFLAICKWICVSLSTIEDCCFWSACACKVNA